MAPWDSRKEMHSTTPSLEGVVALVTGASRGLGRAIAVEFSRRGASVALCARGREALEEAAHEASAAGSADVLTLALDVTDPDAPDRLVDTTRREVGEPTVLVNNASVVGERVPIRDYSPELWRRVLDVNLNGAMAMARAVLPGMRAAARGSIVNVSSGVGDRPRADWGAYAVSKWALEGLSWNLALEEADSGVRVNVVDPGAMRTRMRAAAYPQEDPMTLPEPAAVTPVFVWLASDASVGVTGERFIAQSWTPDAA